MTNRQARGRVAKRKAGLKLKKLAQPEPDENDELIALQTRKIINYLAEQLDIFLTTGGCHKEVMQIGRSLGQLRSKRQRHSEDADEDDLPDARSLFPPPT